MTTLAIARKSYTVAIGADTLVKDGYTNVPNDLFVNKSKLLRFGEHVFALTGSFSVPLALQAHMESLEEYPRLDSELDVFRFLIRLQGAMQEHFFSDPPTDEREGFKESTVRGFLANPSGVYALMELREVADLSRYYALGSGYRLALGAMHAVYDDLSSPADIVRRGLEAAALHDENTGTPVEVIEIELDPQRAQPAKPEGVRPRELAELAVTAHNT